LSLATIVLLAAACTSIPTTSRTGVVHDITIIEAPSPANVKINPGDEVRFVNRRGDYVRVDLLETRTSELTCNRGFYEYLGSFGRSREYVDLEPNTSASACFPTDDVINYNVRMESAMAGRKKIVPAVITVGDR